MLSRFVASQVKHNSYFLAGMVLGLWVALVAIPFDDEVASEACAAPGVQQHSSAGDEFEPQRDERPSGGVSSGGRSVQRPRYYTTELGMRSPLLAGVLSSERELADGARIPALNRTAARLQPALRFFITASELKAAPGLANVVGFTDTREMLKPFHALKYLADNHLEEYDFFFLVSDMSYVNARRLKELVSRLSVSRDVYMGTIADGDSQYCSLDGGILFSNSVLRAIHSELDWCVRNLYSGHHHENIGRCVQHAAHLSCTSAMQGETYVSARLEGIAAGVAAAAPALSPSLADAVTAYSVAEPALFYQLHAYISRVYLERVWSETRRLRAAVWRVSRRHPAGTRNGTWPGGLRADPGLAPPLPDSRFDHRRWTAFNATHALLVDDHHAAAPLPGAHAAALRLVLDAAVAWAEREWAAAGSVELVEGAWLWEPAVAMRYRLLLRHVDRDTQRKMRLRLMEVVRPLGAARLVPVPYVTESARVVLALPVPRAFASLLPAFLARYEAVALDKDRNTNLILVAVQEWDAGSQLVEEVRAAAAALSARRRGVQCDVLTVTLPALTGNNEESAASSSAGRWERAASAALVAVARHVTPDVLLLLARPDMEFNEEFLNRVRMNTISGRQWYQAVAFSRFAQYVHPRFLEANGARPQVHTGRFNLRHRALLSVYAADLLHAIKLWEIAGRPAEGASVAEILAQSALHALRAPEPGLVVAPRGPPCGVAATAAANTCLRAERADKFSGLDLGARHMLAKLLLEIQAETEA